MKTRWLGALSVVVGSSLLGLQACGDDDVATRGPDASTDSPAVPVDGGPPGNDASEAAAVDSGGTSFTVPAAGGSIDVASAAGKITFTFPASAAGKTVTFKQGSAADVGFAAGKFLDVIKMGPDGTRFTDPVLVKVEKKALVGALLTFAETGAKSAPSALAWNATAGAYELRHFTALVIAPVGKVCDSEGYTDNPASARCNDAGAATTFRVIGCKGYSYCINTAASCCVDPAVDSGTGCTVEQQLYGISITPTDSNGGQYPYCDADAGDWDGGDAGCTQGISLGFAANGGCVAGHNCPGFQYSMSCNGTTCTCNNGLTTTGTFAQGATTCDTGVTMQTAYVQKCNFPR